MTTTRIEVQIGGTWVDVTADVKTSTRPQITRGRTTQDDDEQPGALSFILANPGGVYTPSSPTSPYWPNLVRGMPCRLTLTDDADNDFIRFIGRVTDWRPDWPAGVTSAGIVSVGASDIRTDFAGRKLGSDFAEMGRRLASDWAAANNVAATIDAWPLGEASASTSLAPTDPDGPALTVVPAGTGVGSVTIKTAEGLAVEGMATFAPADGVGPILTAVPRSTSRKQWGFWVRTTTQPAAGSPATIAVMTNMAGGQHWRIRSVANGAAADLNLYGADDGFIGTLRYHHADGSWHSVVALVNASSGNYDWYCDGKYQFSQIVPFITTPEKRGITGLTFGGYMNGWLKGKQSECFTGDIAAMFASGSGYGGLENVCRPVYTQNAATRAFDYARYASVPWNPITSGWVINGTTDRTTLNNWSPDRDLAAALAELERSTGMAIWVDYGTNLLTFDLPSVRGVGVYLTVNVDFDAEAGGGMPWGLTIDERPTQVTASWPGGSITLVDTAAAAAGQRRDKKVDTCAATGPQAADAAGAMLARSGRLRCRELTVNLLTAVNDRLAGFLQLRPGRRIRVLGLPAAAFGYTQTDLIVLGWTESYGADPGDITVTWLVAPADDPAAFIFNDPVRGRFAGDGDQTLQAAISATATSAVIVTAAGGCTLTTAAADYPLTLDIGGEDITVTGPPASATSPQTVTGLTRGVNGTVARQHQAGEPVDLATPTALTY